MFMQDMMLLMCFYYMYRSQGIRAVLGANTTQIQKKFVKSRVGDELKLFKMESTQLEQIYRILKILKFISGLELKREVSTKKMKTKLRNRTVLKPNGTV